MNHRAVPFCLLLAVIACAPAGTEEDARQSLMEADRAFSGTVMDADAFLAYLASEVHFLPPDQPRLQGPDAFRESLEQILQLPGAKLTWGPDLAEVSEGGDLGYTIGSFQLTMDGPDGAPVTRVGKYVTLWKRGEGGGWKVVGDTFNFDAPAPGQPEEAGDAPGHR